MRGWAPSDCVERNGQRQEGCPWADEGDELPWMRGGSGFRRVHRNSTHCDLTGWGGRSTWVAIEVADLMVGAPGIPLSDIGSRYTNYHTTSSLLYAPSYGCKNLVFSGINHVRETNLPLPCCLFTEDCIQLAN